MHDHAPGSRVDAAHELRPVGDEHLARTLHDIDAAARQVEDLAQRAERLTRVGLDSDADQILLKILSVRQRDIRARDGHDAVFERHGGVDIVIIRKLGHEHPLVHAAVRDVHGRAVDIKRPEAEQERRVIRPRLDAHLAAHTVRVDDLSCLQIRFLHIHCPLFGCRCKKRTARVQRVSCVNP